MTTLKHYPFSAVVGADEAKLALILIAIDRGIGGVLLRGEKGSAKSTLARGLAAVLPGEAPFVELPVGATEDRVIGSLDLAEALTGGSMRLRPGLLADADAGVLYVDEVNLLPDHLVDVLLDVAASGINRVEREGVAHAHPARFVLIGSMNPEEGELRPQLLDRFGLCVELGASADPAVRALAVRRRLSFDASPTGVMTQWATLEDELTQRVAKARAEGPAQLGDELVEAVSALCASVGVEGLRADLVICRSAAALATWEGRAQVVESDVRRVAPLALVHRARRHPLDRHGIDPAELEAELDRRLGPRDADPEEGEDAPPGDNRSPDPGPNTAGTAAERVADAGPAAPVQVLSGPRTDAPSAPAGRRSVVQGARGRLVGDQEPGSAGPGSVAIGATVRAAVARRRDGGGALLVQEDLREAVREQRRGNLIVLAVDASGSMGAATRMESVKGAVLGLLVDAYQRRDRVALVTFREDDAEVVLRPTASVEVAKARLGGLACGGRTPLAAGLTTALAAASSEVARAYPPLLVVVTDGRATTAADGADPWLAAVRAAEAIGRRRIPAVVVDVEEGASRLGLAPQLAMAMGAELLTVAQLTGPSLVGAVRTMQARPSR